MPYEIVNSLRAKSLVRVVGNTATTITLSALAKDVKETVIGAEVAQVTAVSNGIWRIYRGDSDSGVLLLELPPSFSHLSLYEYDISLANSSTANIHITNSGTAGTIILQLTKEATYSTDTGTL